MHMAQTTPAGMKWCKVCKTFLPSSEFHRIVKPG